MHSLSQQTLNWECLLVRVVTQTGLQQTSHLRSWSTNIILFHKKRLHSRKDRNAYSACQCDPPMFDRWPCFPWYLSNLVEDGKNYWAFAWEFHKRMDGCAVLPANTSTITAQRPRRRSWETGLEQLYQYPICFSVSPLVALQMLWMKMKLKLGVDEQVKCPERGWEKRVFALYNLSRDRDCCISLHTSTLAYV